MSRVDNVEEYLRKMKESVSDENAEKWRQLEELYSKKLWHPLTLKLKELLLDKEFVGDIDLPKFYESVIHEFEHRLNPLSLVQIILPIAHSIKDPEVCCTFFETIGKTVKNSPEAAVLCLIGIAEVKLNVKDGQQRCPEIHDIRSIIEEAQEKLDKLDEISAVHGPFYKVSSIYLREMGDFSGYYKEALRYLGCIDLKTIPIEEQRLQAFCLGLAALLGEDVYNMGEMLAHPILECLTNSKEQWLVDLLFAFNSGNLIEFEKQREKWTRWNDLASKEEFLGQKIRLLCLMEMAFARESRNRYISFNEVQEKAQVKADEVEFLVMKALSKGLIKGKIDQVHQKINVTWVQPRVLDSNQVDHMSDKIGQWCKDVQSIEMLVEANAKEILTR